MKLLGEACSVKLDSVPCNPADMESEKIPAAMIFLTLLGNFNIFLQNFGILCSPCGKLNVHCIISLELLFSPLSLNIDIKNYFFNFTDSKKSEHHLKAVENYCACVNETVHPTISDGK